MAKFASKKAEKLAAQADVKFSENSTGSGKNGTITVADVRELIESVAKKEESKAPKVAKVKTRFTVEQSPSGHIDRFNVIDTNKPETDPNRVVRFYRLEKEAKAYAARLNK